MNKTIKIVMTLLIFTVAFSRLLDGDEEKQKVDEQPNESGTEQPAEIVEENKVNAEENVNKVDDDPSKQAQNPVQPEEVKPNEAPKTEQSRKGLFVALIVFLLGTGAIGGAYLWHTKNKANE